MITSPVTILQIVLFRLFPYFIREFLKAENVEIFTQCVCGVGGVTGAGWGRRGGG